MSRIFNRPKVAYIVLVVGIVGFFALSGVGQSGDKNSSWTWLGDTGWWLFQITILATILYTVALVVRAIRRRHRAAA